LILSLMFRTHLSVLESSAAHFSSRPAFKVPLLDAHTGLLSDWTTITYQQFHDDVERSASYWFGKLERDGVASRSVIGLWIGGYTYDDVVTIYGLSRAGYIVQLFSLRLPNPDVIFELLVKAEAKALIFDATFANVLDDCHIPIYQAQVDASACSVSVLPPLPVVTADDIALVFHTSGSTSGSPKLVRCSYRWLDSIADKADQTSKPRDAARPDVTTWMGSMCHIGQTTMLMGSLQNGACVIQPTTISFSSEELIRMVESCGLNRLNQFAAFLAMQLRAARKNPALLSLLAGLDEVLYSGMPLPREEQEFALQNNIKLRVGFFFHSICQAWC
jgi:acyl-CoA synthetase (AMP-forming)/AMP-acid ligase II